MSVFSFQLRVLFGLDSFDNIQLFCLQNQIDSSTNQLIVRHSTIFPITLFAMVDTIGYLQIFQLPWMSLPLRLIDLRISQLFDHDLD